MAYVSHGPLDYRSLRDRASRIAPSVLLRSAFVAVAAVLAVLALSDGWDASAPASVEATHKSDRLAAPIAAGGAETGRMIVDPATRTTTVERGRVEGLDPQSPMNVVAR